MLYCVKQLGEISHKKETKHTRNEDTATCGKLATTQLHHELLRKPGWYQTRVRYMYLILLGFTALLMEGG
jgi:hypothetical protein